MGRKAKNYELISRNNRYDAIIIKECKGYSYWERSNIYEYLEVSCDFNRKNFRVTEWHYRSLINENDTLANWKHNPENYVSEESINAAKKQLKQNIKGLKDIIASGKNHPAYTTMEEIAHNTIKHYSDDFYFHDTMNLSKITGKFIWMVRDTGTWLISMQGEWHKSIIDYAVKEKEHKVYYWNGAKLKEMEMNDLNYLYSLLPKQ